MLTLGTACVLCRISAQEAASIGLVSRVVPQAQLLEEAKKVGAHEELSRWEALQRGKRFKEGSASRREGGGRETCAHRYWPSSPPTSTPHPPTHPPIHPLPTCSHTTSTPPHSTRACHMQIALKIAEHSAPVVAKAKEAVNVVYESNLAGGCNLCLGHLLRAVGRTGARAGGGGSADWPDLVGRLDERGRGVWRAF